MANATINIGYNASAVVAGVAQTQSTLARAATNISASMQRATGLDARGVIAERRQAQRESMAILAAEAAGNNQLAEALERQARIRQRSLQLQRELGYSQQRAAAMATREADLMQASSRRGGRRGSAMNNIGGVSMQLQDVAVQLQSGTSAATVLAQQGSQVASLFGPAGMIVGGVLAVGAGLYSMGQRGSEAFSELTKGADDLHSSLAKVAAMGSLPELDSWASSSKTSMAALQAEIESLGTTWGSFISFIGGGPDGYKRLDELSAKIRQAKEDAATANEAALKASKDELDILAAKLSGDEAALVNAQTKLDLAKELAKIEASAFTPQTKRQLSSDAVQKASMEAAAKLKEITEREQGKRDSAKMSRDSVATNLAALEAEANGNSKLADALRRQQSIREKAVQIQQQLNVSAQDALAIAQREDALQQKIKGKKEDSGSRIKGFSRARGDKVHGFGGIDGANFSGLERYKRLQEGGRGERRFAAFDNGIPLDQLTSPKRMAINAARQKAGGNEKMQGIDAATGKAMLEALKEVVKSLQPLATID